MNCFGANLNQVAYELAPLWSLRLQVCPPTCFFVASLLGVSFLRVRFASHGVSSQVCLASFTQASVLLLLASLVCFAPCCNFAKTEVVTLHLEAELRSEVGAEVGGRS